MKIEIDDFAYRMLLDASNQLEFTTTEIASIAISSYIKILALPEEKAQSILNTIRGNDGH